MSSNQHRQTASYSHRRYGLLLLAVLADGVVDPREREVLARYAEQNGLSEARRAGLLAAAGWSETEFREGRRGLPESD